MTSAPVVTPPTWQSLPRSLVLDMAPFAQQISTYLATLSTIADGLPADGDRGGAPLMRVAEYGIQVGLPADLVLPGASAEAAAVAELA